MIAIYAGSFDPITKGHLDIIKQAYSMFDQLVILVAENSNKKYLMSADLRIDLIKKSLNEELFGGDVFLCTGLVIDSALFYRNKGIDVVLIRGIRNVTDMISEMALADINEEIGGVKTIFIPTSNENRNFSSSLVKELWSHGKDISKYCPPWVVKALEDRRE